MEQQAALAKNTHRVAFASYIVGFVLSVSLTLCAYTLVSLHVQSAHRVFSHPFLEGSLAVLAVGQLVVQLVFFLHVLRERRPRFNLLILLFAVLVVSIIVIGSLWIMSNLNYRMMSSPKAVNQYLDSQGGGGL